MTERSVDVHKGMKAAQTKFDYFMIGLSAALFAYIGEKYTPQPLSVSSNTIELLALVFLAGSVIAGLKKIEFDISFQAANFISLELRQKRTLCGKAIAYGRPVLSIDTGDQMQPEYFENLSKDFSESIDKTEKELTRYSKRARIAYSLRNLLLAIGFILLSLSKVFAALFEA